MVQHHDPPRDDVGEGQLADFLNLNGKPSVKNGLGSTKIPHRVSPYRHPDRHVVARKALVTLGVAHDDARGHSVEDLQSQKGPDISTSSVSFQYLMICFSRGSNFKGWVRKSEREDENFQFYAESMQRKRNTSTNST